MADTSAATPAKKGRKSKDGAKKKASKPAHPPTLEMVKQAIKIESDPKGTSVMAIKKYIGAHYKVSPAMLNHMLRRAFDAGLAAGKLSRPKGQGESHLLAGRYRLASKEKKSTAAAAAPAKPKKAKSPKKKAAVKKPKAKTPKKKKPAAAKKAKSPKKAVKKSPKKAAKKSPKKSPKKAAKK
ncbi:histone H1-like [Pollicipes pollicipes]|uniref:histone H1-like n=1 Tax=Pollicipes pollicipes TaxID=41117 RepID=UPI00188589EF|nr:histone H1-like [Pollicipes pollicipes]